MPGASDMKPKTWSLPKFECLRTELMCSRATTAGVLEGIWHLTASHNDETGIMPFSEEELVGWLELETPSTGLIAALIKWRWLDEVDGVLYVHDWEEHRPKYVNDRIRKRNYGKVGKVAEGSGKSRKVAEDLPPAPPSDSPSDSPSVLKKEISSASASDIRESGDSLDDENLKSSKVCPEDLVNWWNENILPKFPERGEIRLTAERAKKCQTRLKESGWEEVFHSCQFKLPIPNSDGFCWQPDFDWLIKNGTNAAKLAEGAYDKATGNGKQRHRKMTDIAKGAIRDTR